MAHVSLIYRGSNHGPDDPIGSILVRAIVTIRVHADTITAEAEADTVITSP